MSREPPEIGDLSRVGENAVDDKAERKAMTDSERINQLEQEIRRIHGELSVLKVVLHYLIVTSSPRAGDDVLAICQSVVDRYSAPDANLDEFGKDGAKRFTDTLRLMFDRVQNAILDR